MTSKFTFAMRKSLLIIALALFCGVVSAQGVDFSGNWKLNPSKSKLNEQFSMAPKELVLVQSGNNLSVERHAEFQDQKFVTTSKLTLDGVECINDGMMDTKLKSTASWSDDKNSLVVKTKFPGQNGNEVTLTETYKMDGALLSVETVASGDWGTSSEMYVFDKQ